MQLHCLVVKVVAKWQCQKACLNGWNVKVSCIFMQLSFELHAMFYFCEWNFMQLL
jgi:hypothetical protein